MNLYIFCAEGEQSFELFREAGELRSIKVIQLLYKHIYILNGELYHRGEKITFSGDDKIILRWPWEAYDIDLYDYNIYIKEILERYSERVILDRGCLEKFTPYYEDKLFQSFVFSKLSIPAPDTCFFHTQEQALESLSFPLIAKKRIASRWRHNFIVESREQFLKDFSQRHVGDYIFQELLEDFVDLRIYVYRDKILHVSERSTSVTDERQIRVKVRGTYTLENEGIVRDIQKVTLYMKADLVGFDLLIVGDKYYFIEANLSPQFTASYREAGINIADIVFQDIFDA